MADRIPSIPPLTTQDPAAIVRTVEAIRQVVEILAGQRGVTQSATQADIARLQAQIDKLNP